MTNFEKILAEVTIGDMTDFMAEVYAGHCDQCPANRLCESCDRYDDIGCHDVLRNWLESPFEA